MQKKDRERYLRLSDKFEAYSIERLEEIAIRANHKGDKVKVEIYTIMLPVGVSRIFCESIICGQKYMFSINILRRLKKPLDLIRSSSQALNFILIFMMLCEIVSVSLILI